MIISWIKLLRPQQWIKNIFVFAPLFFANVFMQPDAWRLTILAALAFLSASCVVYILNDWRDRDEDRLHPVKKHRPLASRDIAPAAALVLALSLTLSAIGLLQFLPAGCAAIIWLYVVLNVAYTLWLKRIAIIDIFFIACCYVLRVLMGCYALSVTVSPWIILATFLLALFLGFGKRFHEMTMPNYVASKPNLQNYSRELLDRLVTLTGGAALMTYAIYAAEVSEKIGKVEIVYTVVFVAFGLFRYLQAIYVYGKGGEPEMVILRDPWQLGNLALWLVTTLLIMF